MEVKEVVRKLADLNIMNVKDQVSLRSKLNSSAFVSANSKEGYRGLFPTEF